MYLRKILKDPVIITTVLILAMVVFALSSPTLSQHIPPEEPQEAQEQTTHYCPLSEETMYANVNLAPLLSAYRIARHKLSPLETALVRALSAPTRRELCRNERVFLYPRFA